MRIKGGSTLSELSRSRTLFACRGYVNVKFAHSVFVLGGRMLHGMVWLVYMMPVTGFSVYLTVVIHTIKRATLSIEV